MAAAAGRSLLLFLSSRGGGAGAGGCGALTAGCFPGLGVSRHRQQQQQHHRTVSERARRLRGGRGGAGVWEPPVGRPARAAGEFPQLAAAPGAAGQRGAAVPFRRLRRRPGREGERRKQRGRGGGATAGMFPQDRGHRGGEGRDLNLSLTRPPAAVPPSCSLHSPARCSRTEPGASCPPASGAGGAGRPERPRPPVCVCAPGEGQRPLLGTVPGEPPAPAAPLPGPLALPSGDGRGARSNFIPPGDFLRAWARGAAPSRGMLHCFRRQAPSLPGPSRCPGVVPLRGTGA